MITIGRLLRAGTLPAGLALMAGCAPAYGPGVAIGVSPGPGVELRTAACSSLGLPTPQAGHLALSSSSGVSAVRNRINVLVATYALGMRVDRSRPSEGWKRAATGEC